ncbi:MAG: AraC family transcriptional regulator [Thermomonas sp.]|uniref:helix-turn-helix transcriptional regulator n=1 Tax=Thermomonas sp. TaxID=1971895 RepID=UPI0039E39CF3
MHAPHIDRPICEPVQLRPGAQLRVLQVEEGADALPNTPFPHYHDVCELVLFGKVHGSFVAGGLRYPLDDGCIAFVPSLVQHDFALDGGARDWLLMQADPATVASLATLPSMEALRGAFCARPSAELAARIATLAHWLHDAAASEAALAVQLTQALLCAAASAPMIEGEPLGECNDTLRRLRPAIEALRRDPAQAPSAEQAAALCALSPAYFSRRFHQQLGMAWSEYVRTHRLHLASQWLLESERSAAAISAELGFSTPSHFGELFRQRFGVSPDAYRRAGRRQVLPAAQ